MKIAHQKDRQRGEFDAMGLGADVGGQRHLADIVSHFPHHPAKRMDQDGDLLEFEIEIRQGYPAFLQRPIVALGPRDCFQFGLAHGVSSSFFP